MVETTGDNETCSLNPNFWLGAIHGMQRASSFDTNTTRIHRLYPSDIIDIKRKIFKPNKLVFRRSEFLTVSTKKSTKSQKKKPPTK